MVERDLRTYFKRLDKLPEGDISYLSEDISRSLRLEEGIGYKTTPFVRQEITDEIARTVYCATEFLDILIPEFGLTYNWGEGLPKNHTSSDGSFIIATANMNGDFRYGLICFAPDYLKAIAARLMGEKDSTVKHIALERPLVQVGSHEAFHLDQFAHDPNVMRESLAVFSSSGISGWNKTIVEKEAMSFGKNFEEASTVYVAEGVIFDYKTQSIRDI